MAFYNCKPGAHTLVYVRKLTCERKNLNLTRITRMVTRIDRIYVRG